MSDEEDILKEAWPSLSPYISVNDGRLRMRVYDGERDDLFHDRDLVEAITEEVPDFDVMGKDAVVTLIRELNCWLLATTD